MIMRCGHRVCRDCYKNLLEEQLQRGVECALTQCPIDQCKLVIDESICREILTTDQLEKYKQFQLQYFIQNSRGIKICPKPNCDYVVENSEMTTVEVSCPCGYTWCYKCCKQAHSPLPCEMLRQWTNYVQEEESFKAIMIMSNFGETLQSINEIYALRHQRNLAIS